jgi:hypothetical protein
MGHRGGELSGPGGQIYLVADGGRNKLYRGDHRDVHHHLAGLVRLREGDGCAEAGLGRHDREASQARAEHVDIAYRNAQKLIRTLTNLPVDKAQAKISESFQAEKDAQEDFDSDPKTAHGAKVFGTFPKVELDTSADPPPAPPPPNKP